MSMYAAYLSDDEMASTCSEEQFIRHMLRFETALAVAEAKAGLIPADAAQAIERELGRIRIRPEALSEGTLKHGIPTLPLLAKLRAQLPEGLGEHLHVGATSQDVMDTAQVLTIRAALGILERRLSGLLRAFLGLIERDGAAPCMAHTRWQQATPIPFGLKVVNWALPLVRSYHRLQEMKPRLLVVQFGGATGSLAALGDQGYAVLVALAEELDLGASSPWHAQRDSITAFTGWLSLVTGSLGKMAQDVLLMSQTEIGEVAENGKGGGRSSSMPHKNNPVLSEAVVALARANGQASALQHQSMIHAGERDGASWLLEWKNLISMMDTTATALRHALAISTRMTVNTERMRHNIGLTNGLVFAEQAVTVFSAHIPRTEARALVNQACDLVGETTSLAEALEQISTEPQIDWAEALRPEACFGSSGRLISEAVAHINDVVTDIDQRL